MPDTGHLLFLGRSRASLLYLLIAHDYVSWVNGYNFAYMISLSLPRDYCLHFRSVSDKCTYILLPDELFLIFATVSPIVLRANYLLFNNSYEI